MEGLMEKMTADERKQAFRQIGESLNRMYRGESRPRAVVTEHTPGHFSVRVTSGAQPPRTAE
jgi:hypothetical protein